MNTKQHPRLTVAMIGAGGFANTHIETLLDPANEDSFELVAAIDPNPGGC
jgi:predicted dehydrogenase